MRKIFSEFAVFTGKPCQGHRSHDPEMPLTVQGTDILGQSSIESWDFVFDDEWSINMVTSILLLGERNLPV